MKKKIIQLGFNEFDKDDFLTYPNTNEEKLLLVRYPIDARRELGLHYITTGSFYHGDFYGQESSDGPDIINGHSVVGWRDIDVEIE